MARRESASRCTSVARVTAQLLLSFLAISPVEAFAPAAEPNFDETIILPPGLGLPSEPEIQAPAEHTFSLRHLYHHGTYRHPRLHRRKDVTAQADIFLAAGDGYDLMPIPKLKAKSRSTAIERLKDRRPSVVDPLIAEGRRKGLVSQFSPSAWTVDEIPGPEVTDKDTVLSMAYIAANAYVETEGQPDWEEVGDPFHDDVDFGWEGDGLRGHVWADETNSTIVIGLKGTSMAVFDGDGTTTNDKINDNLFFSCCCGQQGSWSWKKVCDCATGTYSCNNTCVVQSLKEESRYYTAGRELFANVTELYPNANVWLAGHSLGGAVSSLLGLTYGIPVVTFEAVPEALAASRLGLPAPPGADPNAPQARENTAAYHFGHTADPVYIGACNGATASCSYAGYALETVCHTGMECVYDVVADKGWRVGIGTHTIKSVIHDIILKYDTVPECKFTPECRDCANWKMYESNHTDPITSTSTTSSKTRTRTQTCETPGWWGCLDKTTTEVVTTTYTTTSTTCVSPGWFGCKERLTTTKTVTTTTEVPVITTDTSITTTTPITTTRPTKTAEPTTSTTCLTPGRFWGCNDKTEEPTGTITEAPTGVPTAEPSPSHPPPTSSCARRAWYGRCKEWEGPEDEFSNFEL